MSFRKDFAWGAATASFQIEGAWNEDGKSLSIWDDFCHRGGKIEDNSNGDIACDHYHRYKEDVKLMADMGLKAYRFSIAWTRILPDGTGRINEKGLEFYSNLVDELLKYNIIPYVTLYHWDLPYCLQLKGGWANPESPLWFEEYTTAIAKRLGDRVKHFITFNEPSVFVGCGCAQGSHAPGFQMSTRDLLHIGHNVHLAHGRAVKVLRSLVPDAEVGITLATMPAIPVSKADEQNAYDSYFSCPLGPFYWMDSYWADPIVFGKYPEELLKAAGDMFPAFTEEDMKLISQKIDFIGLNIYQAKYVGEYERFRGTPHTEIGWDTFDSGLEWGVKHFTKRYKLPIYITENGLSCHDWISLDGKVHDPNRIDFLQRYLRGLKTAADSGCDVRGYFQWSFMDNFEWAKGYNPRFGMIFCDYKTLNRIPKDSAYWYKEVIEKNGENL